MIIEYDAEIGFGKTLVVDGLKDGMKEAVPEAGERPAYRLIESHPDHAVIDPGTTDRHITIRFSPRGS